MRATKVGATKDLPEGYRVLKEIDLSKNKKVALLINLAAVPLVFLFGWLFLNLARTTSPSTDSTNPLLLIDGITYLLIVLIGVLLVVALTTILHELVHGIFFKLFTKERPRYGFKGLYAYAAAPEWYLPRYQFIVVSLAPLVLLTLGGVALMQFIPQPWVLLVVIGLTMNAAGAVGDIFAASWTLLRPGEALVRDAGIALTVYGPDAS
jgi:hypothetical protein